MNSSLRTIVVLLAALSLFGGVMLVFEGLGAGVGLIILAVMMVVGIVFESRYGRPGQQPNDASMDWHPTGERFVDEETGKPIQVLMDPLTGERRYEPMQSHPPLPKKQP